MDYGAGAAVGGSRPEVGAATRPSGSAPIRADGPSLEEPTGPTQAPVREQVTETIPTFTCVSESEVPTLVVEKKPRFLHSNAFVRFLHT